MPFPEVLVFCIDSDVVVVALPLLLRTPVLVLQLLQVLLPPAGTGIISGIMVQSSQGVDEASFGALLLVAAMLPATIIVSVAVLVVLAGQVLTTMQVVVAAVVVAVDGGLRWLESCVSLLSAVTGSMKPIPYPLNP